jgi:hypothetical protein
VTGIALRRAPASLALLALALCVSTPAHAQAWLPLAREGNLSVAFQHINLSGHFDTDGSKLPGSIPSVANLGIVEFEYGLTDKLAFRVGLPFVASKFTGGDDEPGIVELRQIAKQLRELTPVTEELTSLDTGSYYATFQDFGFTLRYNLLDKGLVVTPLIGATIPSHDYRTVGEAAPGQNRLALHTGVNLGRLLDPVLPRTYVHVRYTYSFVRPVYDLSLNRSTADFEAGHAITPIVNIRALATWSQSRGLHWIEAYNRGFGLDGSPGDPQLLLDHDRLLASRYWHLGGGATVSLTDSVNLDAAVVKFLSGADTHYGVGATVGMTWRFLKPAPFNP